MKKSVLIGILVIVALIVIPQAIFTVDMTKQAIILQMGEYKRTITAPGLNFKIPFIQSVILIENRVLTSDTAPGAYLTLDKKRLVVDHVSRWHIVDPLKFYKAVRNEAGGLARIQPIVFSEMRDELAKYNFEDIISTEREAIMDAVAVRAREKMTDYGVDIIDVRIKRADLPEEVQVSVFDRMKAERQRIALAYRAEGEEEALEIRADADKVKTIILAEAYEESQNLKGDGDAQATATYAAAFGLDIEFYRFLRTLEAYEGFMIAGDTTMVLGSGSDLFQYLESPLEPGG
jgi:membrane protease subunit HflC